MADEREDLSGGDAPIGTAATVFGGRLEFTGSWHATCTVMKGEGAWSPCGG